MPSSFHASRLLVPITALSLSSIGWVLPGCSEPDIQFQDTSAAVVSGSATQTSTGAEAGPGQTVTDASASSTSSEAWFPSFGETTQQTTTTTTTSSWWTSSSPTPTSGTTTTGTDTSETEPTTGGEPTSDSSTTGDGSDSSGETGGGGEGDETSEAPEIKGEPEGGLRIKLEFPGLKNADTGKAQSPAIPAPRIYIAQVDIELPSLPGATEPGAGDSSTSTGTTPDTTSDTSSDDTTADTSSANTTTTANQSASPQRSSSRTDSARMLEEPRFEVGKIAYDYPIESKDGVYRILLPRITPEEIEINQIPKFEFDDEGNEVERTQKAERSKLYMIALYNDIDLSGSWSPSDGFVAASPQLWFAGLKNDSPKWFSWGHLELVDDFAVSPISSLKPGVFKIHPASANKGVGMTSFDSSRKSPILKGSIASHTFDHSTGFIASLRPKEIEDLSTHFSPGPRHIDLALRELKPSEPWELSVETFRALKTETLDDFQSKALQLQTPPGLIVKELSALPIVGYWRPPGVPVSEAGEFLTADSVLRSPVCLTLSRGKATSHAAVLWTNLDAPNASSGARWFRNPIGALYAASLGITPGWGLGLLRYSLTGKGRLSGLTTSRRNQANTIQGLESSNATCGTASAPNP